KFVVFWTRKGEAFEINSGVDIKNSPIGLETVDIPEPNKVAEDIRKKVADLTGSQLSMTIEEKLAKLSQMRQEARLGGGQRRIDQQHARRKLTARERVE
ncbi:MAG: hypothetical protein M1368_04575, partial [Thaumarchaeota archaeon]|nr:hypothetical protein [Nitrososphaerota archaeon]